MSQLYELSKDYKDAIEAYNDATEDADQEAALKILEAIDEEFSEKMGNIYRIHRNYETEIEGYASEEKRFKELRQHSEARHERLKAFAKACLAEAGLPKPSIRTPMGPVRIQNNGGPPSSEITCDAADLPKEYRVVIPMRYEPDLPALSEAWKENKELPKGVSFHRGTHIRFA